MNKKVNIGLDSACKRLLWVAALAISIVIAGMVYLLQIQKHVSGTHAMVVTEAEHIIGEITASHLWLEEILLGDTDEKNDVIFKHLDHVKQGLKKLQNVGEHSHILLNHAHMDTLIFENDKAMETFEKLLSATKKRLAQQGMSGAGAANDQRYDALFRHFVFQLNVIETRLLASLKTHLHHQEYTQKILIGLVLFIIFIVGLLMRRSLRKQMETFEKSLAYEKSKFTNDEMSHALIEQSPFSIQLMSPDGNIIQVNKAWEKMWGTTLEMLGNYNILHDEQMKEKGILPLIEQAFSGKSVTIPIINYNPEESLGFHAPSNSCFVRAFVYPIKNDMGETQQIIMLHEDVTEHYQQDLFLRTQNEILGLISNPATSLKDVLAQLVLFIEEESSSMIASVLLMDESGQYLLDGAAPHLPDAYRKLVDGISIGNNVGSCGTAAFLGKRVIVSDITTDPRWENYKDLALQYGLHACWSQPIKDSEGKVLGTFAMYYKHKHEPHEQDIKLIENASKLARNAIIHKASIDQVLLSKASMVEAQRLSHIGNWELNLVTNKLTWSDEIYRIFEIDKDQFAPSYDFFLDAIHPDDREAVNHAYTHSLTVREPYEINHQLLMKDGRIKHVCERCESFFDADGKPIRSVGTIQDITEKSTIAAKMEHSQRLESLGVLAGGIAHDFNNILTIIMGNASLAGRSLEVTSPAKKSLSNIETAAERAADLCKQMLAYAGKGKFIVRHINLSELVRDMARLVDVSIEKNVLIKFYLADNLPAVEVDIAQMQQIILNLITNASEAIGKKSGIISFSTGVMNIDNTYLSGLYSSDTLPEGRYVFIEVSDTGCGMDPSTIGKIFDPFFTTKFTGRGLGMSAVLGIVRGHQGGIRVYSELGKGTTFKILLPATDTISSSRDDSIEAKKDEHMQGKILVVDDEETIREVAVLMLEKIGFSSLTATDGVHALEVYRVHQHEITGVLLDMTMPKMDGKECFRELRRIRPDVKVILSSGYNEQEATSQFVGQGLAGFIQKPYSMETLMKVMKNVQ
ncbi:MAG: response regulator [Mariprofundaceae bacterium]|nr:response regulator [Mariprofundaceae bacterium]